jgi:hypothetical protein
MYNALTPRTKGVFMKIRISILLALFVGAVFAQTFRGSLTGAVTDPSGGALPDATVKLENPSIGFSRSTITTTNGDYNFPDLAVGVHHHGESYRL